MKQIEEEKNKKVTLYVLNNFIKFERKLYQFAGLPFGRPIKIKTIGYFGGIFIIGIIIYFTPGIKQLIRWIPPGLLILIPITVAWLLTDLGTEGRSPLRFFSSFFKYQYRKIIGSLHYRNKKIPKFRTYTFNNFVSHSNFDFATSGIDINNLDLNENKSEKKAINRITMFKGKDNPKKELEVDNHSDTTTNETVELAVEKKVQTDGDEHAEDSIANVKEDVIDENDDIFGYLFKEQEVENSENVSESSSHDEIIDFLTENVNDDTTENTTIYEATQHSDEQEQKSSIDNDGNETRDNVSEQKNEESNIVKQEEIEVKNSKPTSLKRILNGINLSKLMNNKKMLLISSVTLVVIGVFVISLLVAGSHGNTSSGNDNNKIATENNNNELNISEEDHLLSGIKASSRQNYEEATEHFDLVDFSTLEKDDKEIVLLSYLYTDQVEKILELEPKFDEVVVSYYQAKENLSKIRSLQDLSDEFKFAIAIEDDDYNEIVELKNKVKLDEEKEVAIIKAYIELDEFEDALSFAKETKNTRYIKQLEELIKDEGKNKKKENDDD